MVACRDARQGLQGLRAAAPRALQAASSLAREPLPLIEAACIAFGWACGTCNQTRDANIVFLDDYEDLVMGPVGLGNYGITYDGPLCNIVDPLSGASVAFARGAKHIDNQLPADPCRGCGRGWWVGVPALARSN